MASFVKELPCEVSLLEKALFARRGRQFRIKVSNLLFQASSNYPFARVDDLELQKRRGNPFGLVCPLLDCSRDFKRSGDLTVHFSVEVGLISNQRLDSNHSNVKNVEFRSVDESSLLITPSITIALENRALHRERGRPWQRSLLQKHLISFLSFL